MDTPCNNTFKVTKIFPASPYQINVEIFCWNKQIIPDPIYLRAKKWQIGNSAQKRQNMNYSISSIVLVHLYIEIKLFFSINADRTQSYSNEVLFLFFIQHPFSSYRISLLIQQLAQAPQALKCYCDLSSITLHNMSIKRLTMFEMEHIK